MDFVNVSDILESEDREVVTEPVPEWNGKVARLMAMTGDDRDKFEAHVSNGKADGTINVVGMRALLVGMCLVDANNKRLFSDDGVKKLGRKSAKVLGRLFDRCVKLNGISKEDQEELMENFEEDPSEFSTTD